MLTSPIENIFCTTQFVQRQPQQLIIQGWSVRQSLSAKRLGMSLYSHVWQAAEVAACGWVPLETLLGDCARPGSVLQKIGLDSKSERRMRPRIQGAGQGQQQTND